MASNPSTSTSRQNSTSSAFINTPHPLAFYPPPPPPPMMVPSPFGMYYYTPPTYYYTPQPLPLYTYPRPFPVHQSATAAATSSGNYDGNPQNLEVEDEVPPETQRGSVPPRMQTEHTQAPRRPPRMNQRQAEEGGAAGWWTTLIIKNIPFELKRDFLLKFLDRCCKADESIAYDFFHLPLDSMRGSKSNRGFAFVNLTTNDGAKKMMEILDGYEWRGRYTDLGVEEFIRSKKNCQIKWVSYYQQGKAAQIRRFEKSNFKCDDDEFSPVVFDPPRNGSHPTPPVALRRLI